MSWRMRRALAGCAVVLCVCVATRAEQPGDRDRSAVLARQRDHYLQSLGSLPPIDQRRIAGVFRLHVSGGHMTLGTPLTPWPDFEGRRVRLDGGRLPAAVSYAQFVANDPAARQFDFHLEEYPDNDLYAQMRVQWRPDSPGRGELSIERTQQTARNFVRVFYSESQAVARLLVFSNDNTSDRDSRSFSLAERNFVRLRETHRSEIDQWLRPILRKLEQDEVFAPEVNAAWQVLSAEWPVSPDVRDAVTRLVPLLDDERSRVRTRAADNLARLGREGASAILRLDRKGLSLEQNVRLDEVVSRFRRLDADEVRHDAADPDFLLDCLYCPDPTVRRLAGDRLVRLFGSGFRSAVDAGDPDRLAAVGKLRDRLHPAAAGDPTTKP